MKYISDIDALKACLKLLPKVVSIDGRPCVYLDSVCTMIDAFPKEEVKENEKVLRKM